MAGKLQGIQVARAIAALGVMFFHSNLMIGNIPDDHKVVIPYLYEHGYAGVQLFFVISGFIIAKVLSDPRFVLKGFFIKRFFRLFPVYALATVAAFYMQQNAGVPFNLPDPSADFMLKSLAIWPQHEVPFFQVGWTLEHEVVFYALAALLFPLLGLRWTVIAILALGMSEMIWRIAGYEFWTWHIMSDFNIYFVAGMCLYVFRDFFSRIPWGAALVASAGIAWVYVDTQYAVPEAYRNAARIGGWSLASMALCTGLLNMPARNGPIWCTFVFLGNISYSLYLAHWIAYRIAWQVQLRWNLEAYPEAVRWFGFFGAILLAYFMNRWLEAPSDRIGQRLAKVYNPGHSPHIPSLRSPSHPGQPDPYGSQ